MTYCVYFTAYRGNKLPPFYIGKTYPENIASGYHGSPNSKEYGSIWKQELKDHPDFFETKILSYHGTSEEARNRESFIQRYFHVVKNPMYINRHDGVHADFTGGKHTKETREKISALHKGRKFSQEHRYRIGLAHKGKTISDDHKKRMKATLSILNSGANNHFFGVKHSEETKQIIREKRAKQVISEETRKKMSETHKKRWAKLRGESV